MLAFCLFLGLALAIVDLLTGRHISKLSFGKLFGIIFILMLASSGGERKIVRYDQKSATSRTEFLESNVAL